MAGSWTPRFFPDAGPGSGDYLSMAKPPKGYDLLKDAPEHVRKLHQQAKREKRAADRKKWWDEAKYQNPPSQ